jgi:putative hydrolase of the HAD superfamily
MNDEQLLDLIRERSVPLDPIPTGITPGGEPRAPVRAVLFDVYGTLFVSGSGDIEVLENSVEDERLGALLRRYGVRDEPASVRERYYDRIRTLHEIRQREGVDYPEVVVEEVWEDVLALGSQERHRLFALEYELLFNPVWPCPGLDAVLQDVRSRGMIMGIISNAQFFTPLLFEAFLKREVKAIGFHPGLALYSYVYGYAKPSPFLFERAGKILGSLGVSREHALYVGNDMLNDICTASRTGFQTALFAGDRRSLRLREEYPRCRDVRPDITITDLMQISDVL